jgi:hypothetical protein
MSRVFLLQSVVKPCKIQKAVDTCSQMKEEPCPLGWECCVVSGPYNSYRVNFAVRYEAEQGRMRRDGVQSKRFQLKAFTFNPIQEIA